MKKVVFCIVMLLLLGIAFSIYIISGAPVKTITTLIGVGILLLSVLILLQPYRLQRVSTFLNPELDPLGASFHIRQITLALGNGGLFGQGIGQSKQKYSYIPESSTDSIFAIIAEEIGFLGSSLLLFLFGLYGFFAIKISKSIEDDQYAFLVAAGITSWIVVQVLLNISAVAALVPLTGVPLPFISYGGSSLVMLLCATGILIRLGLSNASK